MGAVKVWGLPAGKGSWRCIGTGGRHQLIPDNRAPLKAWTKSMRAAAQALAADHGGPYDGPVSVSATFTVPRPPSVPYRTRLWPWRRGMDSDKAARALLDALQPDLIADDAQVVHLEVWKAYPDTPGVSDRLDQPGALIRIGEAMPGRDLTTFARWCRQHADQPDADELWALLAAEVEAYLAGDPSVIALEPLPEHDDQEALL